MIINDKVYGKVSINEPVLLELLKSSSIVRLKGISQYGIPDKYYNRKNFYRYDHCVGAMLLLKKLGATLEEQIAGLLHDVSVLAFSHVTDWVFGGGKKGIEDYHDSIHNIFVTKTEIPVILEKYGFDLKRILNEKNFSLLEKHAPDLCADRIDYSLREFEWWLNPKIVKKCIGGLIVHNNEIVFSDPVIALDFALNFLELQTQHWGGYEAMMRYHLFSKALKIAIDAGDIVEKDFYNDDKFVLKKLENIDDIEIKKILRILKNKKLSLAKNKSGHRIFKKFRYTDPKVLMDGEIKKISEISNQFVKALAKYKKINEQGLTVEDE